MNVGANRWQTFRHITFPLIRLGCLQAPVVFALISVLSFPMLGGERFPMMGLVIYIQSMELNNIPFAAAISMILLVSSMIILFLYSKAIHRLFFRRLGL
jgi:putative spermidine/putrescine transport system permease protein